MMIGTVIVTAVYSNVSIIIYSQKAQDLLTYS